MPANKMNEPGNAPMKPKGDLPPREAAEHDRRLAERDIQQRRAAPGEPGRAASADAGSGASRMTAGDLMKRDVATVAPTDTVHEAAQLMRDRGVGFLPVCDRERIVVGTVTDRDITIRVSAAALNVQECRVNDVMTREVVTCRPHDPLSRAEELMATHRKSRLLVTDERERLRGVISLSDLAERTADEGALQTLREVSRRETHH